MQLRDHCDQVCLRGNQITQQLALLQQLLVHIALTLFVGVQAINHVLWIVISLMPSDGLLGRRRIIGRGSCVLGSCPIGYGFSQRAG